MRQTIALNSGWTFKAYEASQSLKENQASGGQTVVALPHTVELTPFSGFSETLYEGQWLYEKTLEPLALAADQAVYVRFDGIAHSVEVFINEVLVGSHQGGYTAFRIEVPPWLKGETVRLSVVVDSRETQNIPPFGHVIDYMTYGGIYREVWLDIEPAAAMTHIYAAGINLLGASPELHVEFELTAALEAKSLELELSLEPLVLGLDVAENQRTAYFKQPIRLSDAERIRGQGIGTYSCYSLELPLTLEDLELWEPDHPRRYRLDLTLRNSERVLDKTTVTLGFRDMVFRASGFYLNGKVFKIRGLNRHQSWPYVGYAMPKRPQVLDAHIMKQELGLNAVRTAHYPQSHYFIEACDRIGLLVFTELPGWQHIGDDQWKQQAVKALEEMILQYRQHCSIMLWGVRINESQDDETFYKRTNDRARALDPYRATGGVRYIKKSQQFEDVYTFNDFSFNHNEAKWPVTKQLGTEPKRKVASLKDRAYLISEYNGHMYPTKTYDDSLHRMEHALRHAHVLNSIYQDDEVAGGFGWCLFDYNTHQDFGSGDRICHHGVLDMYRNHKLAAAVYSAQRPLDQGLVLAAASNLDIGDYPGGYLPPFPVFSNAASIQLYKNGQLIRRFEKDNHYHGALPNPPFWIDDFLGDQLVEQEGYDLKTAEAIKKLLSAGAKYGADYMPLSYKLIALKLILFKGFKLAGGVKLYSKYLASWGAKTTTYTLEALDYEGKVLGTQNRGPSLPAGLKVVVDSNCLTPESSYDVATVRIQSLDSNGNVLSYDMEPVSLETTGDIELIGPSLVTLRGGLAGTYVRTKAEQSVNQTQTGTLSIQKAGWPPVVCHFTIEPINAKGEIGK